MLDGDAARIPFRKLSLPGFGLATTFQDEPFQCSMRVRSGPPDHWNPTAHALHADSTVTPCRSFCVPGLGGCAPVQLWQLRAAALAAGTSAVSRQVSANTA